MCGYVGAPRSQRAVLGARLEAVVAASRIFIERASDALTTRGAQQGRWPSREPVGHALPGVNVVGAHVHGLAKKHPRVERVLPACDRPVGQRLPALFTMDGGLCGRPIRSRTMSGRSPPSPCAREPTAPPV